MGRVLWDKARLGECRLGGHSVWQCPGRTWLVNGDFAEVRYADADGVSIAYCVGGSGPIDLVRVPGILSSIRASTVDPVVAAHDQQLVKFSRLIRIDRRGAGGAGPPGAGGVSPPQQQ